MKLYRMLALLLALLFLITACNQKQTGNVAEAPNIDTPSNEEVMDEIEIDKEDEILDIHNENITNAIHTIPRDIPYDTGIRVISSIDNALLNGDFQDGQSPWQINTVDGIVFDQGLLIENQRAVMQQVVLAQGVQGFEKMKTYDVSVEAVVTGEIPLTIKIRDLVDGALYASGDMVLVEDEELYHTDLMINNELVDGAVFEIAIHTDKNDVVHIKNIQLTRKEGVLIWSDEFELKGLPDGTKWDYDIGGAGWGNSERQYYTSMDSDNTFIKDGVLTIQALLEGTGSNPYTSARMVTRGTFETKYKRIEIRAKLPSGIGTWPAIWMLPSQSVYGTWPASGEIDIMEHVGYDPDIVHGTIHTSDFNHMKNTQKAGLIYVPNSGDDFHIYTIDWTPYEIDFYVDDYLYFTYDNDGSGTGSWPFDQEFYLILCLAIGGDWGGIHGIDKEVFPGKMEVDYVRVYDVPLESTDIEAPSTVTEIDVKVKGTLGIITWEPAMDDYLIDHYEVYLDDQFAETVTDLSYSFYELEPQSNYSIGVVAVDETGNMSELRTTGLMTETSLSQSIEGTIEGESAIVSVGGVIKETVDNTYVECTDEGDYLIFGIDVASTNRYVINLNYSSFRNKGVISVAVDGEVVIGSVELSPNVGEDTFVSTAIGEAHLEAGEHFITITTEKSGFALDYMTFE